MSLSERAGGAGYQMDQGLQSNCQRNCGATERPTCAGVCVRQLGTARIQGQVLGELNV